MYLLSLACQYMNSWYRTCMPAFVPILLGWTCPGFRCSHGNLAECPTQGHLQGLDLKQFNFNTLFLDPPRAGLDPETEKLLPEFDNIMYVSCNPKTQHANLACIQKSHQVQSFAMFDQFPYTDHVECGIFLTRTAHT